jgi:DNA-directed RNA polymerase, mitochondrial
MKTMRPSLPPGDPSPSLPPPPHSSLLSYLAKLTLLSLGDLFSSADEIMNWLGEAAASVGSQGHVMSWITPLGLPVMQPYRKQVGHTVRTILQNITLSFEDEALPVSRQKQRTAFPPNYVHSLDSTHMMMTSLRMKERRLHFTAVHDSYWTHACDVDVMNEVILSSHMSLSPLTSDRNCGNALWNCTNCPSWRLSRNRLSCGTLY